MEIQEKLEMELKKHTEEAASRVTAVLQRAEEQGRMIESLHTSVRASLWPNFVFLLLILFIFYAPWIVKFQLIFPKNTGCNVQKVV